MCCITYHKYTSVQNLQYYIYSSESAIIFLGWIFMNASHTCSLEMGMAYPCMAMTAKSDSLCVVIVLLSHVCYRLTQENERSASVLPMGKTARIFNSSLMLGKNMASACFDKRDITDVSSLTCLQ